MRIHRIVPVSGSNGPGLRFCVWVQGCTRDCPGCFNPDTHGKDGGCDMPVEEIAGLILLDTVQGITVSGGEPFEQVNALAELLVKVKGMGLHTLVYTGYSYRELVWMSKQVKKKAISICLKHTDILIDGAYRKEIPPEYGLTGSGNQRVLELRGGEILRELFPPLHGVESGEFIIEKGGEVTVTGIIDSRKLEKEV